MGKTKTAFIGEDLAENKNKDKKKEAKKDVRAPGLKGGERVVSIGGDLPEIETSKENETSSSRRRIRVRGKKYNDTKTKIDRTKLYPIKDAIKLLKETSYTKFNGSVELHLVVRKEGISANVNLPHGTGKEKKVEVADDKTVEKLKKNKVDFDVLLATPDMMPKLVPFARILGPKGLMPNPKNHTLIKTNADAKKFSTSSITVKTERKAPVIHTVAGKLDQSEKFLEENIESILNGVGKRQIVKAYICSTMSPSIKLEVS